MKKETKRVIVIDGQNWAHRAFHAQSNLTFNGKKIGLIYGFINMLQATLSKYPAPYKVFVCFDHGRNQHRLDLLPDYKKREPKITFDRESFEEQIRGLRKILLTMGIPVLYDKMTEADDLIAEVVYKYQDKYKVIIASGDKDFRQLVTSRVTIQDEKYGRITPKNFVKHFQILPEQYADFLVLWGDSSDKIPGVTGVGEKTAIKILNEYGTIERWIADTPDTIKTRQALAIKDLNRKLINLRVFRDTFGPQEIVYFKGMKKPKFNLEKYTKLCKLYGLKKYRTEEFIKSFRHNSGK